MIKLPIGQQWNQPNNSYKMGSLWATRNINLDEEGIIKLSPRLVNIFDDTENTPVIGDTNFGIPVAFGRYSPGTMYIATKDEPFNITYGGFSKTLAEDSSSNNPNLTSISHGVWFQGAWHESTSNNIRSITGPTWTTDLISNLSSTSVRHYMEVFSNKNSLAVSDGNLVKLYDTSYSLTTTLTLPDDYEVIGMAYNNYKLGIITRLGDDSSGQNSNAFFFTWDGATSEAGTGVDIGANSGVMITAYKSSFVILSSQGQLLYWNGGGFDVIASLPYYYSVQRFSDNLGFSAYGDSMVVDGDTILININISLDSAGQKGERYLQNNPSGIWCYDPSVGLYHKYSPSNSRAYIHWITAGQVNTSTDLITTSYTVAPTGSPMVVSSLSGGSIGGLDNRKIYYIIKVSSSTFRVAATREQALSGDYIDLTSQTDNVSLWMLDLMDFGASRIGNTGAVAFWGGSTDQYTDIITGAGIFDTSGSELAVLNTAVPYMENRGWFITPKLFLNSSTENISKLIIKYRPLDTHDKIIVKCKTKDYVGIPVTSIVYGSTTPANWTSPNEFYTETDLSEAKTALDAGEEMEIDLLSGAGAGQMSKVTSIDYDSGTYAIVLEDEIFGASSGLQSEFIIDNWKVCGIIDSDTETEGVSEIPVARSGKAPQFKIELRGVGTAVEDIQIINNTQIPAK